MAFRACLILFAFLSLGSVDAQTWYVRLQNDSSSGLSFHITRNGTGLTTVGVGANSPYEVSLGSGSLPQNGDVIRVYIGSSSAGTPVYRTDNGQAEYIQGAPGTSTLNGPLASPYKVPSATASFASGQSYIPPDVDYRFDAVIINGTQTEQKYYVYGWAQGLFGRTLQQTFTLYPGAAYLVTYRELTINGTVGYRGYEVKNGPDSGELAYPAFSIISQGPSEGPNTQLWALEDSVVVPLQVIHGYDGAAIPPKPPFALDFSHPETDPPGGPLNEAQLTEGTFKAGVQNLFSQQQEHGINSLTVLREIKDAVGGTGLNDAAGNVSTAASTLGTAGSSIGTAATDLASAAAALNSAASGTPTSTQEGNAAGVGASLGAALGGVANPYADGAWEFGPSVTMEPSVSSSTLDWEVNLGPLVGVLDFNPATNAYIGPLGTYTRNIFIWLSSLVVVIFCARKTQEALQSLSVTPQASAPTVMALGNGGNWGLAFIAISLILGVVAAVPIAWTNFKASNTTIFAMLHINVLDYIPYFDTFLHFFPADVILVHFGVALTYWFLIVTAGWIASIGIRIIPGS